MWEAGSTSNETDLALPPWVPGAAMVLNQVQIRVAVGPWMVNARAYPRPGPLAWDMHKVLRSLS